MLSDAFSPKPRVRLVTGSGSRTDQSAPPTIVLETGRLPGFGFWWRFRVASDRFISNKPSEHETESSVTQQVAQVTRRGLEKALPVLHDLEVVVGVDVPDAPVAQFEEGRLGE